MSEKDISDEVRGILADRTPAPEGEAVAWRYRWVENKRTGKWFYQGTPPTHIGNESEVQTLYASPVVPVGVREVLDAAAAYLKEQYGASHGLDHPVDRARILAALRPTDTGRE